MLRSRKTTKLTKLLAALIVVAVMASLLCIPASAARYASTTGTLNSYSCSATLQFNSSTWGASGTLSYGMNAASMNIYINYTYRIAGTTTNTTEGTGNSNTNNTLLALSVAPKQSCAANVSASGAFNIQSKSGGNWNKTLNINY